MIVEVPRKRERQFVLETYLDDSGNENEPKVQFVCVAGYLMPSIDWTDFLNKWEGMLLKHQLPYLHMKEMFKFKKEREWDDDEFNNVLNDFIDVIRGSHVMGFGVGIELAPWNAEIALLDKADRKILGTANEFALQSIMRLVIEKIDVLNIPLDISLVLDQDEQFAKQRLERLFRLKRVDERVKDRVAAITFANARKFYPLQAADILVWETRKRLIDASEWKPPSRGFKRMMTPLPGKRLHYDWYGWHKGNIKRAVDLFKSFRGLS